MYIERKVPKQDMDKMEMTLLPGFKITWFYTGGGNKNYPKFKNNPYNKQFRRYESTLTLTFNLE